MAYTMRGRDKTGNLVVEEYDNGKKVAAFRVDKDGKRTFSFFGDSKEAAKRKYREDIKDARKANRANNGFTKDRTLRHIGRIPVEAMHAFRKATSGKRDDKALKRFIRSEGFSTVREGSF